MLKYILPLIKMGFNCYVNSWYIGKYTKCKWEVLFFI